MIEAQYKTKDGRLSIKVEGENQKDIFRALSGVHDVFEAGSECGLCHSPDIRFQVRENNGNDYFEMVCRKCTARFSFGQHKQGNTLFPRHRDDQGNLLPGGGWKKWEKK